MITWVIANGNRKIEVFCSKRTHKSLEPLPIPVPQVVFACKTRPRGIVAPEFQFREARGQQWLGMGLGQKMHFALVLESLLKKERREAEVANSPELHD